MEGEVESFGNMDIFIKVLSTLSSGLYSPCDELTKTCLSVLNRIAKEFCNHSMLGAGIQAWFLDKDGGLSLVMSSLKRHPSLAYDLVVFINNFKMTPEKYD